MFLRIWNISEKNRQGASIQIMQIECYFNNEIAVYEVWLIQKLPLVIDKFVLLLFQENSDEAVKLWAAEEFIAYDINYNHEGMHIIIKYTYILCVCIS